MGLIIMSDALTMVFVILSFYFFFRAYYNKKSLVPVFVFATAALMTRYASLFITFPIILFALYLIFTNSKFQQLLIASLLSLIVTIPFFIFQWGALFEVSSNYFLNAWSFTNYFKSSYTTQDGTASFIFPNLIFTFYVFFHPGFIFIGSILSLITLRNYTSLNKFHHIILLTSCGLYIFFLAGIPFQNPRILGLVFPLILIIMFPAFVSLMKIKNIRRFLIPIGIGCITLQLIFFTMTFKPLFSRTIIEKELVTMIQPYQGKTLYSFDVDLALQGRGLVFDYKNLYLQRYYNFQKNDLILFDPIRYQVQWKNKTPMLNWEFIEKNYKLKILANHPKGWKLYQIR
ncbi:hypothetical protein GCM10009430_40210 [Aquimarina litoralis]|uniref:Glycosyltransferase RgtA/B/C/D-like domain-containing protein n=2 Tax=Aquimarina litoralis TaxID=584605 RepID=A0ABP3UC27_9FLAO